ncbi:hypothetical protein QTG56_22500 (plasmid) [Rossellomorea sp. AcN35-11]|nr:hypothetical protein [Rossellomorea aquimaris]WJV32144.1 hypothetical protein QTG56_22500 [Rossellomorea sp. AcN35-11]
MNNVIDFHEKRQEKIEEEGRKKRELGKRRKFIMNMEEVNVLINYYMDYINEELEIYHELITDEDKEIQKLEIRTMLSLLRMLFKKYKKMKHYDDVVMNWNYKNLYYSIMAAYEALNNELEYELLERDEKIGLNLYYRLVEQDHKVGEIVHGPSMALAEMPTWLREQEEMAEHDYKLFDAQFREEFLDKVILMGGHEENQYYVKYHSDEFMRVLKGLRGKGCAKYCPDSYPKGWRLEMKWDDLVSELSGFNVEVLSESEQEKNFISHAYSIELLVEQIADMLNRMESIGLKVSDSFIGE